MLDLELTLCELFPVLSRALFTDFCRENFLFIAGSFISDHGRDKSGIDNG